MYVCILAQTLCGNFKSFCEVNQCSRGEKRRREKERGTKWGLGRREGVGFYRVRKNVHFPGTRTTKNKDFPPWLLHFPLLLLYIFI